MHNSQSTRPLGESYLFIGHRSSSGAMKAPSSVGRSSSLLVDLLVERAKQVRRAPCCSIFLPVFLLCCLFAVLGLVPTPPSAVLPLMVLPTSSTSRPQADSPAESPRIYPPQMRAQLSDRVLANIVPLFFPMDSLVRVPLAQLSNSEKYLMETADTVARNGLPVAGKVGWTGHLWIDERIDDSCVVHMLIQHWLQIGDVERLRSAVASSNSSWNHVYKFEMGPDAFRVALIGDKEITMGMTRRLMANSSSSNNQSSHQASVVYLSSARAYWQGKYRVVIKHDYDDFWAMNDEHDTAYRDQQGKDLFEHKEIVCSRPGARLQNSGDVLPDARPYCSGLLSEYGRYVASSTVRDRQRGERASYKGSEYAYEPVGCKLQYYHSNTGGRSPLSADAATYHPGQGLRILFSGDSQIRTLFWHWVGVLNNQVPNTHKTFNESVQTAGGGGVDFIWDAYFNGTVGRGAAYVLEKRYDVLVLGIGSWPASYGQWSAQRFEEQLRLVSMFASDVAVRSPSVKIIYAGSPAWPKHRKNSPGFRITNYRLGLFNTIARRILGQVPNVRFLPFFELSYPLPKMKSRDSMHYDHSVVLYSAVDYLGTIILRSRS